MVTREERQIELIEKREQYDREQVKGSEEAQKARERMIKEKLSLNNIVNWERVYSVVGVTSSNE